MGSYSKLRVGRVEFSWKYYVPTFLAFLFSESDFYSIPDVPDEEEWFDEIGFRSTCGAVLARMERYGYTVDFFAEVYDVFYEDLTAQLVETLQDEFGQEGMPEEEIPDAVAKHLGRVGGYSRADELREFVGFLRAAIDAEFTGAEFEEDVVIGNGPQRWEVAATDYIRRRRGDIVADFELLQDYFLGRARKFSPAVVRVAALFDEGYIFEYAEVVSLMYTRLLLDATPREAPIVLDLQDISLADGLATAEAVKEAHAGLATILANKINLYNRVFKALSENERDVRETSARSRGRSLFLDLERAASADEKGRALEELLAVIFEADPGFQIVERRFSTGDEEIDLLVKNNVDRPFWTALNSPLVFVECKNWSRRVGSAEARDFEIKLQNHRPLVRLGVFVALAGVTTEFLTEVRRASRADYTLTVIEADDIRRFLDGGIGVVEWLEGRIARPR